MLSVVRVICLVSTIALDDQKTALKGGKMFVTFLHDGDYSIIDTVKERTIDGRGAGSDKQVIIPKEFLKEDNVGHEWFGGTIYVTIGLADAYSYLSRVYLEMSVKLIKQANHIAVKSLDFQSKSNEVS